MDRRNTMIMPGIMHSSSAFNSRVPEPPKELVKLTMEMQGYFPKSSRAEERAQQNLDRNELLYGIIP
eukprot:CAMPEP_0170497744 /NCGR_PEP_ID=MMETSP0208-20121228/25662_1 /TAXON_ID=197538 /ORGANISM="Strombidium inclinatum, Strain S3" /LENGTH=66 /DNA_ID=CAMNT_0010774665 /DNA_START=37 /DNA_END=237 /DNA_ORIENTATION=-